MRIDDTGEASWNVSLAGSDGNTIILHSGVYQAEGDRLIVVGRQTQGSDDGQCERWSQSLVITLNAATGQPIFPNLTRGEQARTPTNRQAIFDITPGEKPGTFVVAGVATVATTRAPRRCVDNMFVGTLIPAGNGWTLTTLGRIGAKDANEVAYSIRPAGAGFYMLAGYRKDVSGEAPAAQAYRVKINPFAVTTPVLTTPFPLDGSDKKGGDRYRLVLPLLQKDRLLLAGSASMSDKGLNQAIWHVVSADLKKNDPPVMVSVNGSDVFDAALSPDGRALAVGRWSDDDGRRVGITCFIGERPTVFDTRPLDSRLPEVTSLPLEGGAYRIPTASLARGVGFSGRQLAAGTQSDFALSLTAPRTLKISTRGDAGDLDLILFDRDKRPLAFSNFKGMATELLIVTLEPGDYTIVVLAQTKVLSYEIRLIDYREVSPRVLAELQRLTADQRQQIADALASAGYATAAESSIAFGAETVRSLLAAQEGAGARPVGPNGIGIALAKMLSAQ
jgi:hypothetical protein